MEAFFKDCASAGPHGCAFHAPTPGAISQKLERILESLYEQPIPVQTEGSYGIVDYSMLKMLLFNSLYQPYALFPLLARALSDLEKGDATKVFGLATLLQFPGTKQLHCSCDGSPNPFSDNGFEAQTAIICTDGEKIQNTLEDSQNHYEKLARQSKWAEIWANIRIGCSCVSSVSPPLNLSDHHSVDGALGRRVTSQVQLTLSSSFHLHWVVTNLSLTGPLGANTSFPLLLIGNTAGTSFFYADRSHRC